MDTKPSRSIAFICTALFLPAASARRAASLRCLGAPFHERDVEYQPGRVFLGSVLDKVHAFDMPPRPVALSEID
jgi:hypothetical protein